MGGRHSSPAPPPRRTIILPPPSLSASQQQNINNVNSKINNVTSQINTLKSRISQDNTLESSYIKTANNLYSKTNIQNTNNQLLQSQIDVNTINKTELVNALYNSNIALENSNVHSSIAESAAEEITKDTNQYIVDNLNINKDLYHAIKTQNEQLLKSNQDMNDLHTTDKQRVYYEEQNISYLNGLNFILFIVYFVFLLLLFYLLFNIQTNTPLYVKISYVIVLLLYPFYISTIESIVYLSGLYIYSRM